jgi:NhaP-type Na+/H+ or K+/H+ antiporter
MISEIVVIGVLFATGLRIDNISSWSRWRPTVRLLVIAMPLTVAAIACLGWALAGMTVAGAVLLGAALSPTDPVLAGNVQVGPPLEGREYPVRFALTAEAGLNHGLAFRFVYLGLLIAAWGTNPADWLAGWLLRDMLYRIIVGAFIGSLIGWLLGRSLFSAWGSAAIATSGPGVLALGAVLLCYGVVEHVLTAFLLLLLGGILPAHWPVLDWRHSLIGFGLLLVIRPLVGWVRHAELQPLRHSLTPHAARIAGPCLIRPSGAVRTRPE